MSRRSRAREVALQLLFQFDNNGKSPADAVEPFAKQRLRDPVLVEFCMALYQGVARNVREIDGKLAKAAENWRVARMTAVDRNILRIGAFELLYQTETPHAVAMDEAIELARRFGTADSSAFVNGILDRLRRDNAPPAAEVVPETPPEPCLES
ncbi:MAG: transcription antitermination factor NusB [Planctomycetota bacterium]